MMMVIRQLQTAPYSAVHVIVDADVLCPHAQCVFEALVKDQNVCQNPLFLNRELVSS